MLYLKRTSDGKFVADMNKNPDGKSYTLRIEYAKSFKSEENAKREKCENEVIVEY